MVNGSPVRVNHAVRSTLASAFTWLPPVGSAFASVRPSGNQDGRLELISLTSAAGGAVYQSWEAQVGGLWRPLPPVPVSFSSRSMGCTSMKDCSTLLSNWLRFEACIGARAALMDRCFRGGDQKHRDAQQQYKNGQAECLNLMLSKGCQCPVECP